MPANDKTPFEFCNLKKNNGQRHNLADQHPERVKEMPDLLEKVRASRYPELP